MTIEDASRRHPAGKRGNFDALQEGGVGEVVEATFPHWRTLDPIRAAALHEAVLVCHPTQPSISTQDVIEIAKVFEGYLTGEEAHGQT
jgi:hypothetical protein